MSLISSLSLDDANDNDELTAQNIEDENNLDDERNDPKHGGKRRLRRRRRQGRGRNAQRRRTTRPYPIVKARKAEVIAFLKANGQPVEIGVRSLTRRLRSCCKVDANNVSKCPADHEFCKLLA